MIDAYGGRDRKRRMAQRSYFIVDRQGVIRYKNILGEAGRWLPTTRWDENQEDQVMNAGASRIHECNKKVSERFVRRRLIGEYSGPDVQKTQSKREAVLTPRRDDRVTTRSPALA
jgi:hypothetical protein